ncbi:MAG: hypothetical protein PHQ28_01995 [Mycobacterium sp.]|nr:hypothetical protein [Mycobacterium sp.]
MIWVATIGIDRRGAVLFADRLARMPAHQALLIEQFTRAGTRAVFVEGPPGDCRRRFGVADS